MIAITALREKIRRKIFIAVLVVSGMITLFFSTGSASISVGGETVTDYKILLPIVLTTVHAVSCMMAAVISLGTVPTEYERRTHHLILTRGISQARYHGELAAANIMASLISHGIFFVGAAVYMAANDHAGDILMLVPAFFISGISIAVVSSLATWLSVFLPKLPAGLITAAATVFSVCYPLVKLLKGAAGGFAGILLKGLLFLLPDLNSIQSCAGRLITEGSADAHSIFIGLFYTYIFIMGIMLCKRKAD